jgi:hypothetical protein
MNRNDFNRIINNSGSVDRQMIGEVKELLNLFPYFQSGHLLLLKGLHNISDVMFESQLKQSAVFIADREVLYHLINKKNQEMPEPPEENIEITPAESSPPDSGQTVIESGKNSQEIIEELSSSDSSQSLLVNEEADENDSGNIVFLLNNDDEETEERITYMDPSFFAPGKDDLLELDLQDGATDGSAESTGSPVGQVATEEKLSRKRVQAELIDKFIIANPRIEPVRDKSDAPGQDISKPFTEEKGGFITETLAKIYITQGYYSRAIDIYEKLSLKFPENSSYCATQIENINELIK